MKNQLTNHQNGRFIKHNDPVSKHFNIQEFNLMEVCEIPITLPDNPSANVFHHKLHNETELTHSIHAIPELDQVFEKERPPLIRPIDFTEDWKRMRRRIANRENREDEDELDLDLQNIIGSLRSHEHPQPVQSEEPKIAQEQNSPPPSTPDQSIEAEIRSFVKEKSASPSRVQSPLLDQVQDMAPPARGTPPRESEPEAFVPYFPEADANQLAAPSISEEELQAIREQARKEGYQAGFDEGAQKAASSTQEKFREIFRELETVIHELGGMQKAVLQKSQENFYAISSSMLEALLEKELKGHPEAFFKIIQRAIDEALPDDDFKINVHPAILKELQDTGGIEIAQNLKADDKLGKYQFRIESKHGLIDARLKDIIQNLLEQADLNLFDHSSSDERAS